MNDTDIRYMTHALTIGARGLGRVWPNPSVGCVIVSDSVVVGRGRTGDGGTPHAETVALDQAGSRATGATAYVTLEPCSHHGRTGPCSDALIKAGIARVVAAVNDPNPQVDGGGFARLRSAGVQVDVGVLQDKALATHAGFFKRIEQGLPWVTLKLAATLDGRIATANGESKWITGPEARRHVHTMRSRHDAVMVGGGTVRADNPSLTVRGLGISHQPVRIVVSSALDLPLDCDLAVTAKDVPVWVCHGPKATQKAVADWQGKGAETIACKVNDGGQVDVTGALQQLANAGLTRVYCEGGRSLAASLLQRGLVDELVCYSAGKVIGADGLGMVGSFGLKDLADAPQFALISTQAIGGDTVQVWRKP